MAYIALTGVTKEYVMGEVTIHALSGVDSAGKGGTVRGGRPQRRGKNHPVEYPGGDG